MATGGFGGHERSGQGFSNEWLTPRWILDALGPFELDPCACEAQPTRCAPKYYTWRDDGLAQRWKGFVWLNPPYGPHAGKFVTKLAEHGNGLALVFARTETAVLSPALQRAKRVLFIAGRVNFETPAGTRSPNDAGAPSMLLAFGAVAAARLEAGSIDGALMTPAQAVDRGANLRLFVG